MPVLPILSIFGAMVLVGIHELPGNKSRPFLLGVTGAIGFWTGCAVFLPSGVLGAQQVGGFLVAVLVIFSVVFYLIFWRFVSLRVFLLRSVVWCGFSLGFVHGIYDLWFSQVWRDLTEGVDAIEIVENAGAN